MEKTIHVKSYTRKDGTTVKEHYRNINSVDSGFVQQENEDERKIIYNPDSDVSRGIIWNIASGQNIQPGDVLTGGVELNVELPLPTGGDVFSTIASVAVGLVTTAAQTASSLYQASLSNNTNAKTQLKTQLTAKINNLKLNLTNLEKISKKYLEKLVNTKDKTEYQNLLKNYTQQKALLDNIKNSISRIEYAADNNNYKSVYNELINYQSNFNEIIDKTRSEKPLYNRTNARTKLSNPTSSTGNYSLNQKFTHIMANTNKRILNAGSSLANKTRLFKDAHKLWKASSKDFTKSQKYIEKNGNLVYSVSQLPSQELQNIVSNKLFEQLNTRDIVGIIFQPDSSLSKAISNSTEIKEYFQKNASKLLKGQIIKQDSTHFNSDYNLKNALGYADILYSYIDADGNFYSIVFDTYDFNPGEKNILVQMARTAQEANIIRNFYTLSIVIIPINKWILWL